MDVKLEAIPAARRSRETENDYGPEQAHLADAPLPDTVDLRQDWHTVPDQGHTASCVGWTVADSLLRWHLVKDGRLAPDQRLSARHVWMSAKEFFQREEFPSTFLEQDGTSLKAGLDVVRKFGAVLESELPWDGFATGTPEDFIRSAKSRRIMAYFNLGENAPDPAAEWRKWLAQSGPVVVLIKVDRHLNSAQLDAFDPGSVDGSHAAALFGYGPDHFLLRSTWGPQWGEDGYARMSLDYAAQAVIESYGVML